MEFREHVQKDARSKNKTAVSVGKVHIINEQSITGMSEY
jgi:hypothetical protein